MTEINLRRKYHRGENRGTRSVALAPEIYDKLKKRADQLGVTIKSLVSVLIDKYVEKFPED